MSNLPGFEGSGIPIYLLTYNCARQKLNPVSLSEHILSVVDITKPIPELIVVALQEFAPLTISFIGGKTLNPYWDNWRDAILLAGNAILPVSEASKGYVEVARHNIGMTGVAIYARRPEKIQWIQYAGVGCGIWEMGNKGSAALKIGYSIFYDRNNTQDPITDTTEIVFVGAHLAAHEYMLERRNADWKTIVRGLVFENMSDRSARGNDEDETTKLLGSQPKLDKSQLSGGLFGTEAHLFVMGDLNYRTGNSRPKDGEPNVLFKPSDTILSSIPLQQLFTHDQLISEKNAGRTLQGFVEADINFPPTYKFQLSYNPDKAKIANPGYSANRWPSWCDRILWFDKQNETIDRKSPVEIYQYNSITALSMSDHKPVALHLMVQGIGAKQIADGSFRPPFEIVENWKSRRAYARYREIVVGLFLALLTTLPGFCMIIILILGIFGIRYL